MYGKDVCRGCIPPTAKALVARVQPPPGHQGECCSSVGGCHPQGSSGVVAAGGEADPPKVSVSIAAVGGRPSLVHVGVAFLYKKEVFFLYKKKILVLYKKKRFSLHNKIMFFWYTKSFLLVREEHLLLE